MKILAIAKRCSKEILRDPLTLLFGLGFPIILLFLLSLIQSNIPNEFFNLESLTPGITIFGLSFISLFAATLISKDKESAFLQRLYTTPLTSIDFILGYILPFIPIATIQGGICYLFAILLGLTPSVNILFALLSLIPLSIFYISLGLLCGSIFNVKQVGAICGALLTNLSAWLSGIWFDISYIGGLSKVANLLPFFHAVELEKNIINGDLTNISFHLIVVAIYTVLTLLFSIFIFVRQIKKL